MTGLPFVGKKVPPPYMEKVASDMPMVELANRATSTTWLPPLINSRTRKWIGEGGIGYHDWRLGTCSADYRIGEPTENFSGASALDNSCVNPYNTSSSIHAYTK